MSEVIREKEFDSKFSNVKYMPDDYIVLKNSALKMK